MATSDFSLKGKTASGVKFEAWVQSEAGGPEKLERQEFEMPNPGKGEAVVKLLYAGVGYTDIIAMTGAYIYAPKFPFVPGYEFIGEVTQIGLGVENVKVGQKVACLNIAGGWAQMALVHAHKLVVFPGDLDPIKGVALILNYVTAYQMLHRQALEHNPDGRVAIFTGLSGGVGRAFLELTRLVSDPEWRVYGTASPEKHEEIKQLGGIPVDYHTQNIIEVVQEAEPAGIDFVFDGLGADSSMAGWKALKKGGKLISFGLTTAKTGFEGFKGFMLPSLLNIVPGTSSTFYGITAGFRKDDRPFRLDLAALFRLLREQKIDPQIDSVAPFSEAPSAVQKLADRKVRGKLVIDCQAI